MYWLCIGYVLVMFWLCIDYIDYVIDYVMNYEKNMLTKTGFLVMQLADVEISLLR